MNSTHALTWIIYSMKLVLLVFDELNLVKVKTKHCVPPRQRARALVPLGTCTVLLPKPRVVIGGRRGGTTWRMGDGGWIEDYSRQRSVFVSNPMICHFGHVSLSIFTQYVGHFISAAVSISMWLLHIPPTRERFCTNQSF